MPKFSSIVRGKRAEKDIMMPPVDGGDGSEVPALVVALDGIEEEEVLVRARERAIAHGIKEPKVGEPIYDLALMVETLAVAVLDVDSPVDNRQPFFDGGSDNVRSYGREAIAYLYQLQQMWQEEVSPTVSKLDAAGTIDAMVKIGGPDEREARLFLERCSPGLLVNLARSMAALLYGSLMPSSPSGSSSASTTASSKSEVAKPSKSRNGAQKKPLAKAKPD